jgi:homoserine dehydrogenase
MRIVLVGFGAVGKALVGMLEAKAEELYRAHGLSPRVVCVIDSGGAAVAGRGLSAAALLAAKTRGGGGGGSVAGIEAEGAVGLRGVEAERVIKDTAADVLVETTPTSVRDASRAMGHLRAAMGAGMHAVSVNKGPLAVAMPALVQLAAHNRVMLRYSGTVGAGTPVLATARTLAAGDRIVRVRGILNGTTNFILHRMQTAGESYQDALAEAVRLGYAETDPSADVDGIDTATKVVILANAVMKMGATIGDVRVSGIRDIERSRVREAAERGMSVKLIGEIDATVGARGGAGRALSVGPAEVERGGPMDVPRNVNAVEFTLEKSGTVTLVGRGAGGDETATAIVRDLVEIWHEGGGGR